MGGLVTRYEWEKNFKKHVQQHQSIKAIKNIQLNHPSSLYTCLSHRNDTYIS